MKNSQGIFYIIGTTILLLVINTVFFLFQSSKNEKNYTESINSYAIIETASTLTHYLKDLEIAQRGFLLTKDASHLLPFNAQQPLIDDSYIKLHSLLSGNKEQQRNLNRVNELIAIKRSEIKQLLNHKPKTIHKKDFGQLKSSGTSTSDQIGKVLDKIIIIETTSLDKNNKAIKKLSRNIQLFTVISNWVLLIIMTSALVNVLQNRDKIGKLFKEIGDKNELLKSQKNELQNLSQDLIKQNAELERFAYVASHDLRSPSVNLISLLRLYEEEKDEAEKTHLITIMKDVSDNLVVKLDDLIEILRSKHESYALHETLNFKEIYSKVEKNLTADIKKTKARINFDFSDAPEINYPKTYLESIMQNLLSNAIKYHHPDRIPEISVRTYYKYQKDSIILEVKDNGLGIDLQKHGSSIFGIYRTFHHNKDSKGVGLYITKAQVVAMGGSIDVVSKPDIGSTFIVQFT